MKEITVSKKPTIKLKDKQLKELEETRAWYFNLEREMAQLRYVQDEIASKILLMRTSEWYWIDKAIRGREPIQCRSFRGYPLDQKRKDEHLKENRI